jgi:putative spermidine/putrescine transport system permease protein
VRARVGAAGARHRAHFGAHPRVLRGALLGLLALAAIFPLGVLLLASVGEGWFWPSLTPPAWTGRHWGTLVGGGGLLTPGGGSRLASATLTSLGIALGAGVVAVVLATPAARAMAELRGIWRSVAAGAAFLPVAAPPLALGVGLQVTFLTAGLGGHPVGVLLAHAIPGAGYVALFLLGVFTLRGRALEDEARCLGASRGQTFWLITLPTLRRPLLEGFFLGFLVSWAQLPLTLLVGQGVVGTLPLEVFSLMQAGQDPLAGVGTVLLVAPPLLLLWGISRVHTGTRPVVVA